MIEIRLDLFEIIYLQIGIDNSKLYYAYELKSGIYTIEEITLRVILRFLDKLRRYRVYHYSILMKITNIPCEWVVIFSQETGLIQVFNAKLHIINGLSDYKRKTSTKVKILN